MAPKKETWTLERFWKKKYEILRELIKDICDKFVAWTVEVRD